MAEELQQISEHVWIYPYNPNETQPNVGVIITEEHTVLIDGGNSPRHARRILGELWRMNAPSVSHIVYTHYHWDHTFGAQIFDALVVSHEQTRDLLISQYASKPWSNHYIQDEIRQNPARASMMQSLGRAIDDWRGFRVILPSVVFSDHMVLHVDEVTLDLRHIGGKHAADSITVEVAGEGVLFVGDCYYPPPTAVRQPGDGLNIEMLQALLAQNMNIYIEGHNQPITHAEFVQKMSEL